jgi:hypothetical protein
MILEKKMKKHYLNLTNGLEFYNQFKDVGYVRIQSTTLESKKWNKVILELDYNFLIDIALGFNVVVIDASAKKNESRAIYQGLPWIKFVLNKRWFNKIELTYVREYNCTKYFLFCYNKLSKLTKQKLDYCSNFLNCDEIRLNGLCFKTNHDGNYKFYSDILKEQQ